MNTHKLILAAGGLCAAVSVLTASPKSPAASPELIEQGRHLVENVAMCVDCHTPRLPTGQLDPAKPLQGSMLGFKPLMEMPWAPAAPAIAGLPGYDEAAVAHLLTQGSRPDGSTPRPPMPNVHLTDHEAKAIIAYLKSLNPAGLATQPQL